MRNPTGVVEHEATTSKISDDQLFYCNQRGLSTEDAVGPVSYTHLPAGGQQEQDREFFHRIFLLILFRLRVGQKYKKYAESGEPRCKVGA